LNILLVEDDDGDADLLRGLLRRERRIEAELNHVHSLAEALEFLETKTVEVILLDMNLPDSSGLNTVSQIQEVHPDLPLVVLSGLDDEDFAVEILNHGAQDYLVKWEGNARSIMRSVRYAIERKRSELRLHQLAHYDILTGLPNRQHFQEHLETALSRASRNSGKVALYFIDLDHFKTINDTLGHHAGDELLVHTAEHLQPILRSNDTLARLGGDEFAVIAEDISGPLDVEKFGNRLLTALNAPCSIDENRISVTASVGVALYPDDTRDTTALLKNADIAMYQSKVKGRNNLHFFTNDMQERLFQHHRITNELREAIREDQLFLDYQPKFDLHTQTVVGAEALVRWQHPERGKLPPGEFIQAAEANGQIVELGAWVIASACEQISRWMEQGLTVPQISINVSPLQIFKSDFAKNIETTILRYNVPPHLLQLELTETALMEDTLFLKTVFETLKGIGLQLAIDDFGTGYSCLQYLRNFPLDVLKIDRSFVQDIGTSRDGEAICGIIIEIARQLQLEPVAEGVETSAQLEYLTAHGCDIGQGFLLARPMSVESLGAMFAQAPANPISFGDSHAG